MALDPSIALGVKPIELQNPLAQYGQIAQIQGAQNQNALARYQLSAAKRADEQTNAMNELYAKHYDPATNAINQNALYGELAQRGFGGQIPVMQAKQQELEGKIATTSKTKADAAEARRKLISQAERDISSRPSDANITAYLEDIQTSDLFSPQEKTAVATKMKQLLTVPMAQRGDILAQAGATASDLTARRGQDMVDARARENIDIARKRLEKDNAMLDPAENAAISKAILDGRLDPNKVNGRNAKILATTLLSNPNANILELGVSASGATAAERSLATQTAKMSTAANEANDMVAVVRDLSGKVDRTEFPTINAITNAVSKGTGGKEIVQLNASINALVNSYARAISPTGQPTVSDKNHAREVINSAYSTGQIGAILDVMQQEMSIARKSAGTASTELKESREAARGRGGELQGQDKQALEWANKNPNDSRAAEIKQRLGVK
jgi:hypothetical protein